MRKCKQHKCRYFKKRKAREAMREVSAKYGDKTMHIYWCVTCRAYHIGHRLAADKILSLIEKAMREAA